MARRRVVVVGGGAAGFFGAIRAAELGAAVTILEAGDAPLAKVRISGGGRCNVTHHEFDVARFLENYPRGARELRGVFARFGAKDTVDWFERHGVELKAEEDGRMFPTTDRSETVIACLMRAARGLDVELGTRVMTTAVGREGDAWWVAARDGSKRPADAVLLATGSAPIGLRIATGLGHTVVRPLPALFSFVVKDPRILGLAGVSVPNVRATLDVAGLRRPVTKEGPLLVTHQGLSAHAILRLSSWAARELSEAAYGARLVLDLAPSSTEPDLLAAAERVRAEHPKGTMAAHSIAPAVPRRLWERLLAAAGVPPETLWTHAPRKGIAALVAELKRGAYVVHGRGDFREEIVTCGGVSRNEVDWTRMESRVAPGIHFAGEILDVDALTGGFNFQNAWSTGWVAGNAMAETR